MARKPRLEYAGAIYHAMGRGDHGEAVFRTDADRACFLATLGEVCGRTGWGIHAYVLMGNHYHLLLETPEPNLVTGMQWLQGTYTKRFNAAHRTWGHLFSGRYKAIPVDPAPNYFLAAADYIHLNPVRVKGYDFEASALADHVWSSYPGYVSPGKRPDWLKVRRVLGELGLEDSRGGRMRFARRMAARVLEVRHADKPWEADEQWRRIRRGWHLGSEAFKAEMLDRVAQVLSGDGGTPFGGTVIRAHDERRAEELLEVGMTRLGIGNSDLPGKPGCSPDKYALAWLVRRNSGVYRSTTDTGTCPFTWDSDGDGVSDGDEVRAGTNPNLRDDVFRILSLAPKTGDFIMSVGQPYEVRWSSVAGKTYSVFRTTNLIEGFTVLRSNVLATPPINTFIDTLPPDPKASYTIGVE